MGLLAPDSQMRGTGLIHPRYPAGISSQPVLDDNLIMCLSLQHDSEEWSQAIKSIIAAEIVI